MIFFFCKQKTAYEMRISDWSSDVCSSDLIIDNTGFKRFTIRNNVDITFSNKLSGRIDLQYVNPITHAPSMGVENVFQWANGLPANQPGINDNGCWGVGWNGSNPISAIRSGGRRVSKSPISEARRVGNAFVGRFKSRCSPFH